MLPLWSRATTAVGSHPTWVKAARGLSGEQGNVAIIVALMATALIGMGALAIDVGAMMVRQSQLQGGADAAAIAAARECAGLVVNDPSALCTIAQAHGTATDYFNANLPGISATVPQPSITTQYDGRAGVVTVTAGTQEPTMFGWALGADNLQASASATARWGPLTAVDEVFPLAVCKGALPEVGDTFTLWSSPSGNELLGECDGAPTALPMGWISPTDNNECTTDITLLPTTTYLDVAPSDQPPTSAGCTDAIGDLIEDINRSRWAPGCWGGRCRRRTIAVYDAARAPGGRHPAYALVSVEFYGARLDQSEALRSRSRLGFGPTWDGVCGDRERYQETEDLQCIRGVVRVHNPPDDGPIVGPDMVGNFGGGISDTTVLDVRLVD